MRTIVVGYSGQDGKLLMQDLIKRNDQIIGIGRKDCKYHNISCKNPAVDIYCYSDVLNIIRYFRPNEIYYLVAHHASSELNSEKALLCDQFASSQLAHVTGLVYFLTAIVEECPNTRLFYASSSMIFSGRDTTIHNELTPISPQGFYGITKSEGLLLCAEFRKKYNVFASAGILFNHESCYRPSSFFSSKIILGALRILHGSNEKIIVGNLDSRTDWGYAKDYVLAFQKVLQADSPSDFIIASGESHSAEDFIEIVFEHLGLLQDSFIICDSKILGRQNLEKIGDFTKLNYVTGWKPTFTFRDFVIQLINDHIGIYCA